MAHSEGTRLSAGGRQNVLKAFQAERRLKDGAVAIPQHLFQAQVQKVCTPGIQEPPAHPPRLPRPTAQPLRATEPKDTEKPRPDLPQHCPVLPNPLGSHSLRRLKGIQPRSKTQMKLFPQPPNRCLTFHRGHWPKSSPSFPFPAVSPCPVPAPAPVLWDQPAQLC